MTKLFLIGLKDLKLMFRDRVALVFMLLAPYLLTIGMGFVTGRFSGGTTGLSDIPIVIVNLDDQDLGNALEDMFNSEELAELVEPTASLNSEEARLSIDDNKYTAAIIIPDGFTQSFFPDNSAVTDPNYVEQETVKIEVYTNPSRPTGAGIIKSIVDEFLSRVEEGHTSTMTSIIQLISSGLISPENIGEEVGILIKDMDQVESTAITLKSDKEGPDAVEFDMLSYFAPGMALMFLMYTVSYGGRSILAERAQGTLPRLMVSPTLTAQIFGGKVLGIFFMGVAQISILILASISMFQLKWGDPIGVIALILASVFGAAGWGMLITAFARTPTQVGSIGSAVMLIFGILGGSFINLEAMPPFFQTLSKITPNAWGLNGFTTLALGGNLSNLAEPILALLVMGTLLFGISVFLFNRNGLVQK